MVIHGRNLIIKMATGNETPTAIAGAKSCRIQVNSEDIETASSSQQVWREFIAGRKDWVVSCDHLLPKTGTPLKSSAAMVGATVTLSMQTDMTGDTLSGSAIVKTWEASGAVGTLAVGSFQFRGSGPLQ